MHKSTGLPRRTILAFVSVVVCGVASYLYFPSISAATFTVTTTDGEINTIAGIGTPGFSGDSDDALLAELSDPHGIAVAPDGTIYFADTGNSRIRKIDTAGVISTIAGTGVADDTGDGGLAIDATLSFLLTIALDPASNNLYVADVNNNRVRRIDLNAGTIHAFAGTGTIGFLGDGGDATLASLRRPQGVAVAPDGSVVIADTNNCRIRRVSSGIINTIAGGSVCDSTGNGLAATLATFYFPRRVNVDWDGNIFIVDANILTNDDDTIRVIDAISGIIDVVAGGGATTSGSGPATDMKIGNVSDMTFDALGNLYIGSLDRVYRVDLTSGFLFPFAGTGGFGFSGDGGPAVDAEFNNLNAVAFDGVALLISDGGNNRLRAVTSSPIVDTIAGNGTQGFSGDGGAPLDAALYYPSGIAVAPDGTIYFADTQNFRIRKIDTAGVISTIAGTGTEGNDSANGEAATSVSFSTITTIALDPATGSLYITDVFANRILRVDLAAGTIHHFAGTGSPEYSDGPVVSAGVAFPEGIAVGPDGSVFIADTGNCRIRHVTGGMMTTIAGSNVCESLGDGGLATAASLRFPRRVHVSANGDVFVNDLNFFNNHDDTVRRIDAGTGLIHKVAGGGATTPGYGAATNMDIGSVSDITFDALGRLYISSITRVYRVDLASGILSPYAGTGVEGFSGDGGPAIDATFYGITALAFQDEALIISDGGNNRLRAVNFTPTPCGNVTGDLILVGTADPVIDLSCVTAVTGSVTITNNTAATSIDLGNVASIGGSVVISGNPAVGAISMGSLITVVGDVTIIDNSSTVTIDLSALQTANVVSMGGNTSAATIDLGSLGEASEVEIANNGAAEVTLDLTSVSGDVTVESSGTGTFSIGDGSPAGSVDLDLSGYTTVSGATAGGETSIANGTTEAVMSVNLPDGAFSTPVSFSITHQDPTALPPEPGTGPDGAALIDPIAAYQFTFSVPTLNQDASLTFDIILDGLDQATRDALLEALANGQATLATIGDAPESTYQAFPICAGPDVPTPDGCVLVEMLDANGQPTAGTPVIVRFSNVVGHFSTWAVTIVSPGDSDHIFRDGFED